MGRITKTYPHVSLTVMKNKQKMGKGRGQAAGPKPPDNMPGRYGGGQGSKGGRRSRHKKAREAGEDPEDTRRYGATACASVSGTEV